jgi:hypothetical protein
MLREAAIPTADVHYDESVWPVLSRARASLRVVEPSVIQAAAPASRAAAALPDVPGVVGTLLFTSYLALIGALAVATTGPGESRLSIVIAALFVVAFFTVPRLFLAQEPMEGRRVTMDQFLAQGIDTYTGHCSGSAALVQMFLVPVLLTIGVLSIAIIGAVVG